MIHGNALWFRVFVRVYVECLYGLVVIALVELDSADYLLHLHALHLVAMVGNELCGDVVCRVGVAAFHLDGCKVIGYVKIVAVAHLYALETCVGLIQPVMFIVYDRKVEYGICGILPALDLESLEHVRCQAFVPSLKHR